MELLLIVIPTFFIPFIWFSQGYQLFGHDIGYHFNTIQYCSSLLYAWNPSINFGVDWGIQAPKALLLLQIPDCVLSGFLSNSLLIQLITSWIWLVLPGIGMFFLLHGLFPEKKYRFFRIFSGLFAIFNFFVLQGWQIVEKTKFSVLASLPLLVLFLYNILLEKKINAKYIILIALLFFFLNGGGLIPLFGGLLVALTVFIVYWLIRSLKLGMTVWKKLGILLIVFVVTFFVNAYTIVPTIGNFISAFQNVVTYAGGEKNFIAWEHDISKNASLVNLFRLEGIPDWYGNPAHPYANQFILKRTYIALSFIPILIILFGALMFGVHYENDEKRKFFLLYLWLLLVIGFIVAGGTHPPFGFLYAFAMKHIPGFIVFRSSFYKFAQVVWFPMIILSGYYLNLLLSEHVSNKIVRKIFVGFCILVILGYHYPFFSKTVFQFTTVFSTRLRLPAYATDMQRVIDSEMPTYSRVLIYPPLDMGYIGTPLDTYTWGYYSLDALQRMQTNKTIVANDLYGAQPLIEIMQQALHDGNSDDFLRVATTSGITHVLWRGDVKRSEAMNRDIPLSEMEQRLASMSALKMEVQLGPWTLYQVDGPIKPTIYAIDEQGTTSSFITSFKKVNPTLYTVSTESTHSGMLQLVFNQQFNNGWQARANTTDGKSFILQDHSMINGFANMWKIDAVNIYSITLEYMPQRYFYYGLVISITSLIGIAIYFVKTRKKHIIRKGK